MSPAEEDFSGYTGTVTGWGRLSEHGLPSTELQAVDVPIMNRDECVSDSLYSASQVTDRMLCAGSLSGGVDSCQVSRGAGRPTGCVT